MLTLKTTKTIKTGFLVRVFTKHHSWQEDNPELDSYLNEKCLEFVGSDNLHEFATALMMISTYDCRQEELDLPELIKDPQIRKKIKLVDKTFDGFMLNLLINDYDLTNYSTFKDTPQ